MRKRNQSGASGRRTSSAGRTNPTKNKGRRPPFKKSGADRKEGSAGRKSFGTNKGNAYSQATASDNARPSRKSYGKSDARPARTTRKSFGSGAEDKEKKSFGQRSRFGKPFSKDASSGQKRISSAGNSGSSSFGRRRSTSAGNPRRPPSDTGRDTSSAKTFSKGPRGQRSEGSAAFGKPYKKSFRVSSARTRPGGPHKRSQALDPAAPKSDKIRLNKFIANSGVSSRREADELIKLGLVSVNGKVVSELGYKVSPTDEVRYEDKVLKAERPVYILMNKPKGFITTTDDPQERKTVMHIVGSKVKERIYPVGRLDRNTTGLLLLTNDGDLADRLMHPSFNVKKVYKVELNRPLTKADFQSILDGVRLEEGKAMVDDLAIVSEDGRTVGIELHIGWNRVVRRIFESLEYEVLKLDRTIYAGLDKKELARGQWRFLTKTEIIHLKHFK